MREKLIFLVNKQLFDSDTKLMFGDLWVRGIITFIILVYNADMTGFNSDFNVKLTNKPLGGDKSCNFLHDYRQDIYIDSY